MDINTGHMTKLLTLPQRSQALPDMPGQNSHFLYPSIITSPTVPSQFVALDVDIAVIFDVQQKQVLNRLGSDDPATQKSYVFTEWSLDPLCPQMSQLAWSPDGRYLAGAYMSSPQIFVWDLQDAAAKKTKDGLQLPALTFGKTGGHASGECIIDLSWSPHGRYLASGASDGTVIIWKVDQAA